MYFGLIFGLFWGRFVWFERVNLGLDFCAGWIGDLRWFWGQFCGWILLVERVFWGGFLAFFEKRFSKLFVDFAVSV